MDASDVRFRALFEAAPDPIAIYRGERRVYANVALARFLGFGSPAEMIGMRVQDSFHPDEHEVFRERHARRARGETLPAQEYRLIRTDGTVVVAEMTSISIEFDGGPAVLVMMRDRTDKRRLEEQLRHSERMASIGALAAGVAHEINNPLAYVMTNLEVAAERRLPDLVRRTRDVATATALREVQKLIEEAREGLERVRAIARDLRTLSRADDEHDTPIDVAQAAEAATAIASHELRRARLIKSHGAAPKVRGPEGKLVQVLVNLLVNAAQALPDAGGEIRVRTRASDGCAVIEVEDTGVGIAAAHLARIFEPFFTTKPRGVGTGLGLSIAKGLVEALGGTISVDSVEGRGTTVRVALPAAEAPSVRAPRTPKPNRLRARILIVDDEPLVGRALALAFDGNHEVVLARDGQEALDAVEREPFDAVLCDVNMPSLSGLDVFDRVAANDPQLAARFVFVTGGVADTSLAQRLTATKRAVLQKPFALDDVTRILAPVLGR